MVFRPLVFCPYTVLWTPLLAPFVRFITHETSFFAAGNQKNLICRTNVSYLPFPLRNHRQQNSKVENFTYIIFRRKQEASSAQETPMTSLSTDMLRDDPDWPRIVQPPRRSSGHVTLRLCCSDGNAYQSIITKSNCHHVARKKHHDFM